MNYIQLLYRLYRFLVSGVTSNDGGFKHIWNVAFPLIIMSATLTIMQICDRKFLSMQSTDYVAAALPAGMLAFNIGSFFLITINFSSAVVSQYFGKKNYESCVKTAWAAIAFALCAGFIISYIMPYIGVFFINQFAANVKLNQLQLEYFLPLASSTAFACLTSACCSYFSGQSLTKVVAIANIAGMISNIFLDYILIFGNCGFPALGLTGAGVATTISALITSLVALGFFINYRPKGMPKVSEFIGLDVSLIWKILKFGSPIGLMVLLDVGAWYFAMSMVGYISDAAAAAITITISINQLSFMPMLGFTDAASIIFGQNVGRKKLILAEMVIYRSWLMIWVYMCITGLFYLIFPDVLINFFAPVNSTGDFSEVLRIGKISLICAAFYNFLDASKFIIMGALRGAGDTKVLVVVIVLSCWLFMVPAMYLVTNVFQGTIELVWGVFATLIVIQNIAFFIRFKSRAWTKVKMTS